MLEHQSLHLIDVLPLPDGRQGLLGQRTPTERLVVWPGEPPLARPPLHPGLAPRVGTGADLWVEQIPPGGVLLAWLAPPLRPADGAEVFALLADALAILHDQGLSHGDLSAARVVLDGHGLPVLIGVGSSRGGGGAGPLDARASMAEDCQALLALWRAWCPQGPLLDLSSAAAAAEGLRIWLSVSGEPATPTLPIQVREAQRPPLDPADPLALSWSPDEDGPVDEVGVAMGPDEGSTGLLDALTWSHSTGESTRERTGWLEIPAGSGSHSGLSEDTHADAPHAALLAHLHQTIRQPLAPDRFGDQEGSRAAAVLRQIQSEALDVLPSPDSAPRRAESASATDRGWEEHTATQVLLPIFPLPPDPAPPTTAPSAPLSASAPPSAHRERSRLLPSSLEISPLVLQAAVVAAMLAGAAGIWLLLSSLSGP